ncbi:MAG: hypothetical protein ABI852_12865 [Gemmatimonadaceae bacterium]
MSASLLLKGTALSLIFAATVSAQDSSKTTSFRDALYARSSVSLTAIQSRPQDALARNIGLGYGANATYLFRLDRSGIWSIRADLGVARYGNESHETPFSETVGGRVNVDVSTSNYVMPMSVGMQMTLPTRMVRPYANAGLGGIAFFTESTVNSASADNVIASTTNQSSTATSWSVGGGAYVPISFGKIPVGIDGGVQYLRGGSTRYLAQGGIIDLPDARIAINSIESTTRMMLVHLGVRIGR